MSLKDDNDNMKSCHCTKKCTVFSVLLYKFNPFPSLMCHNEWPFQMQFVRYLFMNRQSSIILCYAKMRILFWHEMFKLGR